MPSPLSRVAVLALLGALALPSSPGLAVPAQDDAGTGADAPDSFADALRLAPGAYRGSTDALGPTSAPSPLLDQEDWYAFEIPAGANVSIASQRLSGMNPGPILEMYRPDGRFAALHLAGARTYQPGGVAGTILTDVGGWWALRVYSERPSEYLFDISWKPATGDFFAAPGPGHVTVGYELGQGARVSFKMLTYFSSGQEQVRRDYYVYTQNASMGGNQIVTGIGVAPASARAGDARAELRPETRDANSMGEYFLSEEIGPGRVYVTILIDAAASYTMFTTEASQGDVTFLGGTSGPAWSLRASDLSGGVGGGVDMADASVLGSATLDVQHALVGAFDCGNSRVSSCTLTQPDGSSSPLGLRYVTMGAPGAWTFERRHGGLTWDDVLVLAADVELPGA